MAASVYLRGGIPIHVNQTTAVDTVEQWNWQGGVSNQLIFRNSGANPVVLSFSQADADNDVGFSVAAGDIFDLPAELANFWTKSTLGTSFESIVLLRRG